MVLKILIRITRKEKNSVNRCFYSSSLLNIIMLQQLHLDKYMFRVNIENAKCLVRRFKVLLFIVTCKRVSYLVQVFLLLTLEILCLLLTLAVTQRFSEH